VAWNLDEQVKVAQVLHEADFMRDEDESASLLALRRWTLAHQEHPTARWIIERLHAGSVVEPIFWFACWARSGYPRVTMGHRLAASMIATQAPAEAMSEVPIPWPAYLIEVPHGLLKARDLMRPETPLVSFDLIMVRHRPDGFLRLSIRPRDATLLLTRGPYAWDKLLETSSMDLQMQGRFHDVTDTVHERVLACAARLTASVELELADPKAMRAPRAAPVKKGASSPAKVRSPAYALVREVAVDVRAAVEAFATGHTSNVPAVRTLVRGHWRRQACGPRHEERRWMHVEPYWRGPEDGPVAVGVHRLRP